MKIAVIGSGNMGRALGTRWAHLGHEVLFAARSRDKAVAAAEEAGNGASAVTLDEAARSAEVILWSPRDRTPGNVLQDPSVLADKVVIDIANRSMDQVRGGAQFTTPLAVELAEEMPSAHVVKAFNTIAMEALDTDPQALRDASAQLPIAGDSSDAKSVVRKLAEPLGFTIQDLGDLASSRAIELLADALRLAMIDAGMGWRQQLAFLPLPDAPLNQIGERGPSSYQ